jgi:DNA-binding transcriptional LysR family regulator
MNFDWNRAKAFWMTAEKGSLSAAARVLGQTQPTVGRQVSALEDELGVTLFERVGNGLVLTESGLKLLEHVRSMGDAAEQVSLRASGAAQQLEGLVTISVGEMDAIYRIPRVIPLLRHMEPGIRLDIQVSNAISDLKRREADIAIRSFRPKQSDLIARKLTDERIWIYGVASYLDGRDIQSDLDYIGFDQTSTLADILKQGQWPDVPSDIDLSTSFQVLQVQLVKAGLGVCMFPESVADQEPELVPILKERGPFMEIPLWLVSHRELHTSLRVRRVYDVMVEQLADAP